MRASLLLAALATVVAVAAPPASASLTLFRVRWPDPTTEPAPDQLVTGADGTMWYTIEGGLERLATSGRSQVVLLPALSSGGRATGLTVSADGSVWATETRGRIARVTPQGATTEVTPPSVTVLYDLAQAADGAMWWTDPAAGIIGRLDPAGTFSAIQLPVILGAQERVDLPAPAAITAGPDGNLWVLELVVGAVLRLTPTGAITQYYLPAGHASDPTGIASGPDGALWITEPDVNRIARMSTDGAVKEYPLPTRGASPKAIVSGPDHALWFTEIGPDRIGRLDPATGAVTEYALPKGSTPAGLTFDHTGDLWCTLTATDQVARLTPGTPPVTAARRARRHHHAARHHAHHRS